MEQAMTRARVALGDVAAEIARMEEAIRVRDQVIATVIVNLKRSEHGAPLCAGLLEWLEAQEPFLASPATPSPQEDAPTPEAGGAHG